MNKTIFNLNTKISIIIISSLGILLGFLANAFYVVNFIDFVFYVFRAALFIGIYIILQILEKKNLEFKNTCKRMIGYLVLCYLANSICVLFSLTHIIKGVFLSASGIICFWTILVFVIEILKIYFDNKLLRKFTVINEKIGLAIANPIVKLIEDKATND